MDGFFNIDSNVILNELEMGNHFKSNNYDDTTRFDEITRDSIAEYILYINNQYISYKQLFLHYKIDGIILYKIDDIQIKSYLMDLGITNFSHIAHLAYEFIKIKQYFIFRDDNSNNITYDKIRKGKFECSSLLFKFLSSYKKINLITNNDTNQNSKKINVKLNSNINNNNNNINNDNNNNTDGSNGIMDISINNDDDNKISYNLNDKIQGLYRSMEEECTYNDEGKIIYR